MNHKNNVVVTECYAAYLLGGIWTMYAHGYEVNVVCLRHARVSKRAVLVTWLLDLWLSRRRGCFRAMAWRTQAENSVGRHSSVAMWQHVAVQKASPSR